MISFSAVILGVRGLAGHWLVGGEQLFSFVLVVFLGFYFSLFVIFPLITVYYYYYFISIIKLFLSQPVSFLTFTLPVLFPHPSGGRSE